MSLVRAFIAIEIPSEIQSVIEQKTAELRNSADSSLVRWVKANNLHLTLKFLGDVSSSKVPFLTQMLRNEAAKWPAFEMDIGRLGAFPATKRARVIWIGIQPPPTLADIQRSIELGASRLGYSAEERDFSPHLTIGRVRQHLPPSALQQLQQALESHPVGPLGRIPVDAIHLIKSDLRPGGSEYTPLFSAPLSASQPER